MPAVELVTIGQRHGLGLPGGGDPRYVVDVDVPRATVTVGAKADLLTSASSSTDLAWAAGAVDGPLAAQMSAHGRPIPAGSIDGTFVPDEPMRRVAPGQSVVLYDGDEVVGGGIVAD